MKTRREVIAGLAAVAATPSLARPAYNASAVRFDGLSLLRRNGLIGQPSGKYLASAWIRPRWIEGETGRVRACLFQASGNDQGTTAGSTVYFEPTTPNLFLYAKQDDLNGTLWYRPDFVMPSLVWHHWLVHVDVTVNPPIKQFYLNDVPISFLVSFQDGTHPYQTLDLLQNTFYMPDWMVAGRVDPPKQDMADVWIGYGQSLDLSIAANRRKFRSADGRPVSLGRQGRAPTGKRPTIFFSGGADEFASNRGTGGSFSLVGSLSTVGGP